MLLTVSVVNKVIELAKKRQDFERAYTEKYFSDGVISIGEWDKYSDTVEYKNYQGAREVLENYLNSLDFDVIKELQVLMYLGRDNAYAEESVGLVRFNKYYEEFVSRGWRSKAIEIHSIKEKLPLADYLTKGKEIVGL